MGVSGRILETGAAKIGTFVIIALFLLAMPILELDVPEHRVVVRDDRPARFRVAISLD